MKLIDINNFENFSEEEHYNNLLRLGITTYNSLVGMEVYYSHRSYGLHKVLNYNPDKVEFLLELNNEKFWSNPFLIFNKENNEN